MFEIEMLDANEGDALWITYGSAEAPHRVLVDCGRTTAYTQAAKRLASIEGEQLDLLLLTHVDDDHIYGAVRLLRDARLDPKRVKDVWFNGWAHLNGKKTPPRDQLGAVKGEYFAAVLIEREFAWNEAFGRGPIVVPASGPLPRSTLAGGMEMTLVSPSPTELTAMRDRWEEEVHEAKMAPGDWEGALKKLQGARGLAPKDSLGDWLGAWDPERFRDYAEEAYAEDTSEPNGSSIAVVAEYDGKRVLLCGDAYSSVLVAGLKRFAQERGIRGRIPFDAVKIPHHGSKANLSAELVAMVRCDRWLVSTDGARHAHPDPQAIARIVAGAGGRPHLFFNHDSAFSAVWRDRALPEGFATTYGDGTLIVEV